MCLLSSNSYILYASTQKQRSSLSCGNKHTKASNIVFTASKASSLQCKMKVHNAVLWDIIMDGEQHIVYTSLCDWWIWSPQWMRTVTLFAKSVISFDEQCTTADKCILNCRTFQTEGLVSTVSSYSMLLQISHFRSSLFLEYQIWLLLHTGTSI